MELYASRALVDGSRKTNARLGPNFARLVRDCKYGSRLEADAEAFFAGHCPSAPAKKTAGSGEVMG